MLVMFLRKLSLGTWPKNKDYKIWKVAKNQIVAHILQLHISELAIFKMLLFHCNGLTQISISHSPFLVNLKLLRYMVLTMWRTISCFILEAYFFFHHPEKRLKIRLHLQRNLSKNGPFLSLQNLALTALSTSLVSKNSLPSFLFIICTG